jgi:hypothetical protein
MPSNGVGQAVRLDGRNDAYDLFDHPGGYIRPADKNAVGQPGKKCGRKIENIRYLVGACCSSIAE